MPKVTVVGSYIVAQVIDADRIPAEGETVTGRNYHVTHGGKGSNMACCASRLGVRSGFIGKVGRDGFGAGFIDLLKSENVSTEGVLYSERVPTAVGFIVCGPGGSNIIVIDRGANDEFSPADVEARRETIQASDAILSPLEIRLETALAAARIAAACGVPAILNPAPAENLRSRDLSSLFALTPNEGEARVCLGLDAGDSRTAADCARALLDLGPRNVFLTLGSQGALWASADGLFHVPALAVNVVDTVGAGDAFNAGLAAGVAERRRVEVALALAVTAASLSTRYRETIASYPLRDEVDSRVAEVLTRIEKC